jgi:hypothetical protein
MSFLAKLTLDGKIYNILEYHYNPNQQVDESGKPISKVFGGQITLTIESTQDKTFLQWAINPNMTKEGTIVFYKRDAMSKLLEIKFETAYCVHHIENFSSKGKEPMSQTIKISPGRVIYEDVEHEETWNVRKVDMSKATTFEPEEDKEKFDEQIKVIDSNGNPIKDLIYCVEFNGKIIDDGRTDDKGLVKRLEKKETKEKYTYYWGDEALYKIDNN